jgi:hypothetical protein
MKRRMAEIVSVTILFETSYVSSGCQVSWVDLYRAQTLSRAGGRCSLFFYNRISVCLSYLPASKRSSAFFKTKLFKERLYRTIVQLRSRTFVLKELQVHDHKHFFYMNFSYFNNSVQ